MENFKSNIIVAMFSITMFIILYGLFEIVKYGGSKFDSGEGQYTGTIVETQHHGFFFKTYAAQLKTEGFTTRFEDFCILDPAVYNQLSKIDRNKKVTVTYKKILMTSAWQCAFQDSNDVITSIKIEDYQ
jgi:hypothetical protein